MLFEMFFSYVTFFVWCALYILFIIFSLKYKITVEPPFAISGIFAWEFFTFIALTESTYYKNYEIVPITWFLLHVIIICISLFKNKPIDNTRPLAFGAWFVFLFMVAYSSKFPNGLTVTSFIVSLTSEAAWLLYCRKKLFICNKVTIIIGFLRLAGFIFPWLLHYKTNWFLSIVIVPIIILNISYAVIVIKRYRKEYKTIKA